MGPAAVTDLLVHPREGDLVVGTYGRGVWVTNIVPLRGINTAVLSSDAALLPIRSFAERNEGSFRQLPAARRPLSDHSERTQRHDHRLLPEGRAGRRGPAPQQGGTGRGGFGGAPCVADGGDGRRPYVTIADASGKVVCTLVPASHAGINDALWSLGTYAPPSAQATPGGRGGRGGGAQAPPAAPGEYTFTLNAGGKTYLQKAKLVSRAPGDSSRGRGVNDR